MKKFNLALIMLFAASLAAHAQTVGSANVMGYSKVDLAPGYSIIRVPFVDSAQSSINIQDIFDTSALLQGSSIANADSIQLWDSVGLEYVVYYLADGISKATEGNAGKWFAYPANTLASNTVAPDTGFFFVRNDASTVTNLSSGSIVIAPTGTNSLNLVEGYNLVANPFTSEWKLNDGSFDWVAAGGKAGSSLASADSIQFWNSTTLEYDEYYLADGISKATEGNAGKWFSYPENILNTNLTVGTSEGIFYSRLSGESTLTLDMNQPYTLD